MVGLLAAGIGVCILDCLPSASAFPSATPALATPCSSQVFVVLCTGIVLLGMWLAVRELSPSRSCCWASGAACARCPGIRPYTSAAGRAAARRASCSRRTAGRIAATLGQRGGLARQAAGPRCRGATARTGASASAAASRPGSAGKAQYAVRIEAARQGGAVRGRAVGHGARSAAEVSFESAWPTPGRTAGTSERPEPQPTAAGEPAPAEPAKLNCRPSHGHEVRRGRRHGLHALFRRLHRSAVRGARARSASLLDALRAMWSSSGSRGARRPLKTSAPQEALRSRLSQYLAAHRSLV